MSEKNGINRRTALKTLGGAAVFGTVGGASLIASTGAAAAASFTIDDASITTADGDFQALTVSIPDYHVSFAGFDTPVYAVYYKDTVTFDKGESDSVTEVIYDGSTAANGIPVLATFDDWGGSDEYAENLGLGTQHERQSGDLHAGIDWNIAVDTNYAGAKSVEQPWTGLTTVDSVLEEATSGGTEDVSTVAYTKEVVFLKKDSSGLTANDGTNVSPLGGGDTKERATATAEFTVTARNEASSTSGSGSGSSSLS